RGALPRLGQQRAQLLLNWLEIGLPFAVAGDFNASRRRTSAATSVAQRSARPRRLSRRSATSSQRSSIPVFGASVNAGRKVRPPFHQMLALFAGILEGGIGPLEVGGVRGDV